MHATLRVIFHWFKKKKAIIKSIPKSNKSPIHPINYRPIPLLEVPAKLYERITLGRVNIFWTEHNIIKDKQHGFRAHKGTITGISTTYESIATKTFDKVWHNGLKYKLLCLKLLSILEKTLCNFLDNRKAQIRIGKDSSEEINLLREVPQGSVFSPTLYTLFTNDLPSPGPGCIDTLFADDITRYNFPK